MVELVRAHDWSRTHAGPIEAWPESLHTIVNTMLASRFPMFVWWGRELVAIYNDAYRAIIADKHPQALGQSGSETWAEIWDVIGPMVEHVFSTGEATWSENQRLFLARQGFLEETYFTFSYSPILDGSNTVRGIYATVAETTGQVLGERRLRTLGDLAARTADAVEIDEACRLAADALAENRWDLPKVRIEIDPEATAREGEIEVASGSIKLFVEPSPHLRLEDGYRRFLELVASQLSNAVERITRIKNQLAELDQANRAKDEFLAMLGHELRNPLAPMVTALELMKMRSADPPREQQVLARQVGHLSRLVDDLLDVSRITQGRIDLHRKRLELSEIVARGLEVATPLFERRKNRVIVDVPATGLVIDGDPDRLAQVLSNLLTNAAKYSDVQTTITVTAACIADRIRLSVKDEGVGIAPEMLDRVFGLFVQQSQTLARSQGGLGIGLAIARSLIELHGGTIRVFSAGRNQGSEFVIELPVADGVPAGELTANTAPASIPTW